MALPLARVEDVGVGSFEFGLYYDPRVPKMIVVDHAYSPTGCVYEDIFQRGESNVVIRHSIWQGTPIEVGDFVAYSKVKGEVKSIDDVWLFEVACVEKPSPRAVDARFLIVHAKISDERDKASRANCVYTASYCVNARVNQRRIAEYSRYVVVDILYLGEKGALTDLTALLEAVCEQGASGISLENMGAMAKTSSGSHTPYVEVFDTSETTALFDRVVALFDARECEPSFTRVCVFR